MTTAVAIGLYIAVPLLVLILGAGIVNLARTDEGQPSRSNKLMRMRVIVQAVVIGLLVLLGIVMGSIKLF